MPFILNSVVVLSGAGTYSPPALVSALIIRMVGAGGGGGGATSGLAVNARGSGGGGGGFCEKFLTPLAASYAYSVGVGGTGGPNNTVNGTAGGNTTFGSLTANGGNGGNSSSVTADGATQQVSGGTASGGDLNAQGAPGHYDYKNSGRLEGAYGGGSYYGGGARQVYSNSSGVAGPNFGSGGGGAISQNNSQAGGNGANGTIIIFEYKDAGVIPSVSTPVLGGASGTIPFLMTQNQIYACPANAFYVFYNGTAPEISNDGLTFAAVPSNNIVASAFIRSPGTDTLITLKKTNNKGGKKK